MWLGASFSTLDRSDIDIYGCRHGDGVFDSTFILMLLSAFLCGTIFGVGLTISQMTDPARVIGFLDLVGRWDPTLLFVMGGALAVTTLAFPWVLRRKQPLICQEFHMPTKNKVDAPLLLGATMFGIGWGLGGFCPGPAIAALATGSPAVLLFVGAMIAGQWIISRFY